MAIFQIMYKVDDDAVAGNLDTAIDTRPGAAKILPEYWIVKDDTVNSATIFSGLRNLVPPHAQLLVHEMGSETHCLNISNAEVIYEHVFNHG